MAIAKNAAGTRGMRGVRWAALVARVMNPVMLWDHRRKGDTFQGKAVLYLTTVGAKTGQQRKNAVGYELDADGAWLVVASFGGAANNPGWYHNMAAHPEQVWIEVGGQRHRVHAEQLDGPRRDGAWKLITERRPTMAEYQVKTDRVLPVLRLTRV
ncbi:nitroreductase/quinone reductase family protein [Pseudonocardia sp. TRM90224]|uniref:nitroreductase/quinone reductase family protein n=1 Tax=Pseudonocardia sp. TRM90224 TaxID=2812678 RepID=UPI001E3A44F7|nr:nitroreductase/quinone reductase family protein [Pseudonocardia sp. TRM90224]